MKGRVQSVERGIDVLMTLVQGPKTLTEVMRETGLSKGTTFRILTSLAYENLVVKNDGAGYTLGPGCLRLIDGVMGGFGTIVGVGRAAVESLWEACGETVAVHARLGIERVCIEELPSESPVRYISTVGSSAPLHIGSAGRVLMAFADSAELEGCLGSLVASGALTDVASLRSELEVIRSQGYGLSVGERVRGAAAISVPIYGRHGFVAALSIIGPDFRLTNESRLALLPELRRTADVIGVALTDAGQGPAAVSTGALK